MALLCTEKTNLPYNDHFNIIKPGIAMRRNVIYNFGLKSIHLAKVSFSERLLLLTM